MAGRLGLWWWLLLDLRGGDALACLAAFIRWWSGRFAALGLVWAVVVLVGGGGEREESGWGQCVQA